MPCPQRCVLHVCGRGRALRIRHVIAAQTMSWLCTCGNIKPTPLAAVHRLCLNIFLLLIFRTELALEFPAESTEHQTSSTICCLFYGGGGRWELDSSTCATRPRGVVVALAELAFIMKNNHKSEWECGGALSSRMQGRRTMGNGAKSGTCMRACHEHRTSPDRLDCSHCYTNEIY